MTLYLRPDRLIEIPDSKGELHNYELRPCPRGLSEWACEVRRLDSGDVYRVSVTAGGAWLCSCRDHAYRVPRKKARCKHAQAIQIVYALRALFKEAAHGGLCLCAPGAAGGDPAPAGPAGDPR